jgi:hypothetical protein
MASARLDFVPPPEPDIVALRIYEAATQDGVYAQIERTTAVGTAPDWISYYTTDDAASATGWFRIAWETTGGVVGPFSPPVQGGTSSLISKVVARVMQRNVNLDEALVYQSAQYVIATFLNTENPDDPALTVTIKELEGLTLLTLARASMQTVMQGGQSESFTAGLVSMKSETKVGDLRDLIKYLTDEAALLLGITNVYIMLLEDIDPTGIGSISAIDYDQSRLLMTEIP